MTKSPTKVRVYYLFISYRYTQRHTCVFSCRYNLLSGIIDVKVLGCHLLMNGISDHEHGESLLEFELFSKNKIMYIVHETLIETQKPE